MNKVFLSILLFFFALTAAAQQKVKVLKQQSLKRYGIPAGNYSGITHIGGNRYAVCNDKRAGGFHVWEIDIDSLSGKVRKITDCGFRGSNGTSCQDAEGIAYVPELQTIFMASEADSRIYSFSLDGTQKPEKTEVLLSRKPNNSGLEGLTYDRQRQCLWTMEENDGKGRCQLQTLSTQLSTLNNYLYTLDVPTTQKHGMAYAHGISAICAMDDGRLLILEREAFVPQKKIGAWVRCKLYAVEPEKTPEKQLMAAWRTRLNLTTRSWANYEGICLGPQLKDGRRVLILISDSQNRYGGILQDRIRTVLLYP